MDSITIPNLDGFTVTSYRAPVGACILDHRSRRCIHVADRPENITEDMVGEYLACLDVTPADYLEYLEHIAPGRIVWSGGVNFGESVFTWAIQHGYAKAAVETLLRLAVRPSFSLSASIEAFPDLGLDFSRDSLLVGLMLNDTVRGGLLLRDGEVTVHT